MKILYCLFLVSVVACQGKKQTSNASPDPVRDLLIDRSFWESKSLDSSKAQPVNVHRLSITNTSHQFAYKQIEVRFDYYDSAHHKVDTAMRTIEKIIEPRSIIAIKEVNANQTQKNIASATATIVTAQLEAHQ